jgi:hypothetical protein
MTTLFLMIIAHIVDDFVLQPQSLSDLKQKDYWWRKGLGKGLYKYDYLCALLIHSISWSIMISLPILFMNDLDPLGITNLKVMFWINIIVHFIIDHLKANLKLINLWIDQSIHFIQIFILYAFCG